MITVKEAIESLKMISHQHGCMDDYPECPLPENLEYPHYWCLDDIIELLTHLSTENEQLKVRFMKLGKAYDNLIESNTLLQRTLSEIKKHQTAGNALKFALARNKELEAENEQLKARVDKVCQEIKSRKFDNVESGMAYQVQEIVKSRILEALKSLEEDA